LEPPPEPTSIDRISAFAVLVKNVVRPSGLHRMGLPSPLLGSGMAFPWSVLERVSLASGALVQDMPLGLDLLLAGHAPLFCAEARIWSRLPKGRAAARSQRMRWEHGT